MFVCPTCKKPFKEEGALVKHYLKCWKELHPNHKAAPAPRSEDIVAREDTSDLNNFIEKFRKG